MKSRAKHLGLSMFVGSVAPSVSDHTEANPKAVTRTHRGSDSSADGQLEVSKSKKSHRSRASPKRPANPSARAATPPMKEIPFGPFGETM